MSNWLNVEILPQLNGLFAPACDKHQQICGFKPPTKNHKNHPAMPCMPIAAL